VSPDPSPSRTRFLVVSVLAAALATGLAYLLVRFVFHDQWSGLEVAIFFVGMLLAYLVSPFVRQFFWGPARK
jgi:hypothetical protein